MFSRLKWKLNRLNGRILIINGDLWKKATKEPIKIEKQQEHLQIVRLCHRREEQVFDGVVL